MKIDKILRLNHHPVFLGLFAVFLFFGMFIKSAYVISISCIFLFRYLVDIKFLEKLRKEKPFFYMLFYVSEITFIAIFLPKIIEKFLLND
jgi:hypothetical protein